MTPCFTILRTFFNLYFTRTLLAFGKLAIRKSDIIVGFHWHRGKEQFRQTRFIRITHWRLAILLDPLGMLDPQVIVNLLKQASVGVDLVSHDR